MNAKTAPLDDRPLRTEPIRPTGDAGDGWGRAAAYDAYADGLHTYAIWVMRDHDAAVDTLYCTFVLADRHITQLRQPEHIQPWLYAIMRRECMLRAPSEPPSTSAMDASGSPSPVSGRLRPPAGPADPGGSLASLERNLRRAEFHSLEWPESEGLTSAHREILELTIRHGLDSQGLGLVLGLGQSGRLGRGGDVGRGIGGGIGSDIGGGIGGGLAGVIGSVGSQGFGVLADAWRELERSLAAVAVAKASREHCAQLAELTFGWSGRLTATLRAPLTDHVDGCTRCQHYLHTVIGTPAAPTILPFVAAPRALREIVLAELHDPQIALRLGIDHAAIAARIERFTPNGFPAVAEPASARRRGGRRAAPKGNGAAAKRKSTVTQAAKVSQEAATAVHAPAAVREAQATQTVLPQRIPGASARRADTDVDARVAVDTDADTSGVYRTPGSWAARVLPADPTIAWRPGEGSRAGERRAGSAGGALISTPSGRFASRVPSAVENTSAVNGANGTRVASVATSAANGVSGATPTARMPRLAAPEPEAPRDADGRTRPSPPAARHKVRPMRQAVLSAVTLGAVGAAAAAAAALLGAASNSHSPQLSEMAPPQDPVNTPTAGGDGLSVSVSTPPAPNASVGSRGPNSPGVGVNGSTQGAGPTGVSGSVHDPAGGGAGVGAGGSSGQGANAADFKVSVNLRDGDPNSVTILLRNIGGAPIAWSASAHDPWIVLSQSSGTLGGGQSQTIIATATNAAPSGSWTSTVTFTPSGAVVTLRGVNSPTSAPPTPPTSAPPTTVPPTGSPSPSSPGQSSPPPSPRPTPPPTPSASSSPAGGGRPSTSGPSRSASVSPSASASATPSASGVH